MSDFTITMDPQSYADTMRKMDKLSKLEQTEVVAKGLSEGVSIIAKQTRENIKQRLQKHSGNLLGSVAVLTKKKDAKAYAGFRRPKGAISHVLDKGTTVRNYKGANRGKARAYKFHTDAVEQRGNEALNELRDSIEKSINTILNR